MSESHNVLALDVGERRVGVALASLEAKMASPLTTIDRQKRPDIYDAVKNLVKQHSAETVVVGLPRGMSGQDTAQTEIARLFASELSSFIESKIVMQDEAGTSLMAEERLKSKGKSYEKGDIDMNAAVIILEDWLAALPLGGEK